MASSWATTRRSHSPGKKGGFEQLEDPRSTRGDGEPRARRISLCRVKTEQRGSIIVRIRDQQGSSFDFEF
jgi:hypothetical protein